MQGSHRTYFVRICRKFTRRSIRVPCFLVDTLRVLPSKISAAYNSNTKHRKQANNSYVETLRYRSCSSYCASSAILDIFWCRNVSIETLKFCGTISWLGNSLCTLLLLLFFSFPQLSNYCVGTRLCGMNLSALPNRRVLGKSAYTYEWHRGMTIVDAFRWWWGKIWHRGQSA